jgi:formate hydrogenlyase subunit 6/NADH:ubiquinone oxidoreductase subunit I
MIFTVALLSGPVVRDLADDSDPQFEALLGKVCMAANVCAAVAPLQCFRMLTFLTAPGDDYNNVVGFRDVIMPVCDPHSEHPLGEVCMAAHVCAAVAPLQCFRMLTFTSMTGSGDTYDMFGGLGAMLMPV